MVQPRGGGPGLGLGADRGAGHSGKCVCLKCGAKVPHKIGIPCYQQKCPKCGSVMTRE